MSGLKPKTYSGRTIARMARGGKVSSSTPGKTKNKNCQKSPLKNFGMKYNPTKGIPKQALLDKYQIYLESTRMFSKKRIL